MEEYLLLLKNYIKKQIDELDEGKEICQSIKKQFQQIQGSLSNDYNELNNQFKEIHDDFFYIYRKIDLKNLLDKIEIALKANCEHICCVDYVDINEYRMQKIQYCEKCWTEFSK